MAKKEKPEKQVEEKPRETTVEFLASLAAVLVTGLFIITFVLQAFEIPSSSMENTLLIGDHVFVNRIQFAPADALDRAAYALSGYTAPGYCCISFARGTWTIRGEEGYRHSRRSYSFAKWCGVS